MSRSYAPKPLIESTRTGIGFLGIRIKSFFGLGYPIKGFWMYGLRLNCRGLSFRSTSGKYAFFGSYIIYKQIHIGLVDEALENLGCSGAVGVGLGVKCFDFSFWGVEWC